MTRIAFIGDPNAPGTDPASIEIGGVAFPLGEAIEVSDETLAAKLGRHSHFQAIDGPAPIESPRAAAEPLSDGGSLGAGPALIKRGPGRPPKVRY